MASTELNEPTLPTEVSTTPSVRRWGLRPSTWVAVLLLLVGAGLRYAIASLGTSTPGIDENEIVEQAVAFMGGNLHHYFPKYGPLTMYVLAGVYHVVARLHGLTALDYASQVFFEGSEHYLIARLYCVGWLSVLAGAAFFSFRKHHGVGPGLLALCLLGFPLVDRLAPGARIDMPQAAFQGLALLALYEVVAAPRRLGMWALAGVCAGLAIATKPLPGLLVIPSFALAAWFGARATPDGSPRALPARLGAALATPGLWLAALACVGCALGGNPNMRDIFNFVATQRAAVALHSGAVTWSHESVGATFLRLQLPFVVTLLASCVVVLVRREPRALVSGLFVVVYCAAFYGRASRAYYHVASAAVACLLVAHGVALAAQLVRERWGSRPQVTPLVDRFAWAAVAVLCLFPVMLSWRERTQGPNLVAQAESWIYEHIPPKTRIYYIGRRPAGPRLVATKRDVQARWGDHFDYGRNNYVFLQQAFDLAFARYAESGKPRYNLSVYDSRPGPRKAKQTPRGVTDGLLKYAQDKQIPYIIIGEHRENTYQDLGYRWFSKVQQVAEFGKIVIFKVPLTPPPAQVASGTAPPPAGPVEPAAARTPPAVPPSGTPPKGDPPGDEAPGEDPAANDQPAQGEEEAP